MQQSCTSDKRQSLEPPRPQRSTRRTPTKQLAHLNKRHLRRLEQQFLWHERQLHQRRLSDDYLIDNSYMRLVSMEDSDDHELQAARTQYMRETQSSRSNWYREPALRNLANSSVSQRQRTIATYNQSSQSPTKDLQTLVLALTRQQLREEIAQLSEVVIEQNPFEMRNMRLNSFIANTPELMDHWKVAMLGECVRIIDESLASGEMAWVTPSTGAERELPMTVDEQVLVSVPQDKPEISKSQVATEYIQAQRGQQGNDQDDFMQLFQNDMLKAEFAGPATPEVFEKICSCHRLVVQKVVEIEYIEKKPETCQAVSSYIEQLKTSFDRVVQDSMTQSLVDAVEQGRIFVRTLVGQIMADLHDWHEERNFEPTRVQVVAQGKN